VTRSKYSDLTPPQKGVIALGLLVLALGLGNLGRAVMALYYAARLPDLPMTVSWTYLAVTGASWGITLVVCAVGLIRLRSWGRRGALIGVTLYQIHVWINHLLFDASDYARQTWSRDLVLTLLLLALVWGGLNWSQVRKALNHDEDDEDDEETGRSI